MIFSMELDSSKGDWTRFSTPRTTPSLVWMPMVVEPSLMASMAYSIWNIRPSGLNDETDRSYTQPAHTMP